MPPRSTARAFFALLTVLICGASNATFIVRFETVLGDFDVWMRDDVAPLTVQNFMNYVERGDYTDSIVNRVAFDAEDGVSVIQGGGFFWNDALDSVDEVFDDVPLPNEFLFGRSTISNTRGTMAMAQLGGDPNSATNEWFINLDDNSTLDAFNPFTISGPFVVFGQVTTGLEVVDAIASLQRINFGGAFTNTPVLPGFDPTQLATKDDFVLVTDIRRIVDVPAGSIPLAGLTGNYAFLFPLPCVLDANTSAAPNPSPDDAPQGVTFPEGFFSFNLQYVTNPLFGCPALTLPFSTLVDLELPAGNAPNVYYRYGPTPDNPTPHWYDFSYDGRTGARFFGSKVLLAFVDGERGDSDLTVNDVIQASNGVGSATQDSGGPGVKPGVEIDDGDTDNGGGGSADALALLALAWLARLRATRRRTR